MIPNFLILGAQRAGTTSLYQNLIRHEKVFPALKKEIHFFDINYNKGLSWYQSNFNLPLELKPQAKDLVAGEATPYYIFHPLASKRIAQHFPKIKLIILFRNPIDRAYSHYNHIVRLGYENLSFEEAIRAEKTRLEGESEKILGGSYSFNHQYFSYISRGIYVKQLKTLYHYFAKKQILILKSEDFFREPLEIFNKVLEFLNLSTWKPEKLAEIDYNKYPKMKEKTRKKLVDFFEPYNKELTKLINNNFLWD